MFIAASLIAALLADIAGSAPESRSKRRRRFPSFAALKKRYGTGLSHDFDDLIDEVSEYDEEIGKREARARAWEVLESRYDEAVGDLSDLPDPVPLYRVIKAEGLSAVNLDDPGRHWSWDHDAAEAHWGSGHGRDLMLVALVPHADIDWTHSVLANIMIPEEREVYVRDGATAEVSRVVEEVDGRHLAHVVSRRDARIPAGRAPETRLVGIPSVDDADDDGLRDDVIDVFEHSDVRVSRDEEPHEAVVDVGGRVLGGTVVSAREDPDFGAWVIRFSVAVRPDAQRRGVARRLIQSLISSSYAELVPDGVPVQFEAWVINPAMVPLLESLGFEGASRGWSEDDPFFYRSGPM